jgi:phosphomannomutase
MNYIFDVDGTLTPSRGKIDQKFSNWFEHFQTHNSTYMVTGSDKVKTLEQVGLGHYHACIRVYNCAGNDVWEQSKNIKRNKIIMPDEWESILGRALENSLAPNKTGNHFDVRSGLFNFSTLGRNATLSERADYVKFDNKTNERVLLVENLQRVWVDYDIQVAGETGIDIMKKGFDKAQIIHDFGPTEPITFFGDKMEPGGNDYTLALEVAHQGGTVHQVKNWEETWQILKQ